MDSRIAIDNFQGSYSFQMVVVEDHKKLYAYYRCHLLRKFSETPENHINNPQRREETGKPYKPNDNDHASKYVHSGIIHPQF